MYFYVLYVYAILKKEKKCVFIVATNENMKNPLRDLRFLRLRLNELDKNQFSRVSI